MARSLFPLRLLTPGRHRPPAAAMLWVAVAVVATAAVAVPKHKVLIAVKDHNAESHKTRDLLRDLLRTHDVAPYTFTRSVVIDADAIPHSHPRLTLHTRHRRDPELLLSTYIHEQLHWYLDAHPKNVDAAVQALTQQFSSLPVGFPHGAKSLRSSYEHLLVNMLEIRVMRKMLGELKAKAVLDFWCTDHYTKLYEIVRDRSAVLMKILESNALIPDMAEHAHRHDPDDAK